MAKKSKFEGIEYPMEDEDGRTVHGVVRCGCCGEETELKSSKKGKPYYNCGECGFQGFSRRAEAVQHMMDKVKGAKNGRGNETHEEKGTGKAETGNRADAGNAGSGEGKGILEDLGW